MDDFDDDHHRDANHRSQCKSPTQSNGPIRILVKLVIGERLVLHQWKDKTTLKQKDGISHNLLLLAIFLKHKLRSLTHHTKDGCDQHPAPFHPAVGSVADHVLYSIVEIISPYKCTHTVEIISNSASQLLELNWYFVCQKVFPNNQHWKTCWFHVGLKREIWYKPRGLMWLYKTKWDYIRLISANTVRLLIEQP